MHDSWYLGARKAEHRRGLPLVRRGIAATLVRDSARRGACAGQVQLTGPTKSTNAAAWRKIQCWCRPVRTWTRAPHARLPGRVSDAWTTRGSGTTVCATGVLPTTPTVMLARNAKRHFSALPEDAHTTKGSSPTVVRHTSRPQRAGCATVTGSVWNARARAAVARPAPPTLPALRGLRCSAPAARPVF